MTLDPASILIIVINIAISSYVIFRILKEDMHRAKWEQAVKSQLDLIEKNIKWVKLECREIEKSLLDNHNKDQKN